jgi:hypothetical protein
MKNRDKNGVKDKKVGGYEPNLSAQSYFYLSKA